MAKDYVLFIHGVTVRDSSYADSLKETILKGLDLGHGTASNVKFISLYWGDIVDEAIAPMRRQLTQTETWSKLWFQDTRTQQLLAFAGDAALYISRHVGFETIQKLATDALAGLEGYELGDRLHLVTHSWGTVITFDALFADRWTSKDLGETERALIRKLRNSVLGTGDNPEEGLLLGSISTMGSPILLFNLINQEGEGSSHGISDRLRELLQRRAFTYGKLPWFNFIHPGDPIAWPLEGSLQNLVGDSVQIKDELVRGQLTDSLCLPHFLKSLFSLKPVLEVLGWVFQKTPISLLLNGGNAHGSYWTSATVARRIAEQIQCSQAHDNASPEALAHPNVNQANRAAQPVAAYSSQA